MAVKKASFIYSSGSIEALENLVEELSEVFGLNISADDIFYYGVFCEAKVYACYENWENAPYDLDVPLKMSDSTQPYDERIDYVKGIINSVLKGEIEKPEWMEYVEEEEEADEYGSAPSTYLHIIAKNTKYNAFANALINFLYSPNMISAYINYLT